MKIKLDENIPASVVECLNPVANDIHTVHEEGLTGVSDLALWQVCQREQRFLITQDLDFSDIRRFRPGTHPGILLLRLKDPGAKALRRLLSRLMAEYDLNTWRGCLVVASERKIRIQK